VTSRATTSTPTSPSEGSSSSEEESSSTDESEDEDEDDMRVIREKFPETVLSDVSSLSLYKPLTDFDGVVMI